MCGSAAFEVHFSFFLGCVHSRVVATVVGSTSSVFEAMVITLHKQRKM